MSRSHKAPFIYLCAANPAKGKATTSRSLRRRLKHAVSKAMQEIRAVSAIVGEIMVDDPRDRKRGEAGSKDGDRGWDYFGDGSRRFRPEYAPAYRK